MKKRIAELAVSFVYNQVSGAIREQMRCWRIGFSSPFLAMSPMQTQNCSQPPCAYAARPFRSTVRAGAVGLRAAPLCSERARAQAVGARAQGQACRLQPLWQRRDERARAEDSHVERRARDGRRGRLCGRHHL
eukprot:4559376-Pleurochrysis_carterae.AAC.1